MLPQDIKALRVAYKLTQKEFASAIGVQKQTLYFWEKGKYSPSRYDVIVICKLWKMLHSPKQRAIAQNALDHAKNLPAPKNNSIGQHVIRESNVGYLLSEIFSV